MIDLSDLGIPRPWGFFPHVIKKTTPAEDLLRHLPVFVHFWAAFAVPSPWQAIVERLDGDLGHRALPFKSFQYPYYISPTGPWAHVHTISTAVAQGFQVFQWTIVNVNVWKFNIFSCVFEVPKVTRLWVTAYNQHVAGVTLGSDHRAVLELGDHPLWLRGDLCEPNWFQPWHDWSRLGRSHCQNQRAACAPTCAHLGPAFRWWVAVIPGCDGGLSQQREQSQMKQWCPCFPVLS